MSEELVMDTGSDISLGQLFRARKPPPPLVHQVASVSGPTPEEVTPWQATWIHARWLLTRE